jgi:phospholipid/cholesterol/gamma-HCH transport system substrate-binding protein
MTDRFPGLKFLVFTVVCVVAAVYLIQVTGNLRRIPLLSSANIHEAVLDDVSGLVAGDDVRLAGVPVGRVRGLRVEDGRAVVRFEVDPEVPITDTWDVAARWKNVIGQRYLYLYPGDGGQRLADGARIPIERSRRTADIGRFFNEITPLLRAIDPEQQNKLLDALNTALVGREDTVQDLVRDLGSLGSTVADQEAEIRTVLREGSALLAEYNRREDELGAFLTDLSSVGGVLAERNDELLAAVTDIGTVQAELGDLVRRNDDTIRGSVSNLEEITAAIGRQRDDLATILDNTRDGLATYMLISRWGQWFNVRIIAVQAAQGDRVIFCQTEAGEPCDEPNLQGPNTSPPRKPSNRPGPGGPDEEASRERQQRDEEAAEVGSEQGGTATNVPPRLPAIPAIAGSALRGGER